MRLSFLHEINAPLCCNARARLCHGHAHGHDRRSRPRDLDLKKFGVIRERVLCVGNWMEGGDARRGGSREKY